MLLTKRDKIKIMKTSLMLWRPYVLYHKKLYAMAALCCKNQWPYVYETALSCKNQKTACLSERTNLHGPTNAQTQVLQLFTLQEQHNSLANECTTRQKVKRGPAITRGLILINRGECRLRTTRTQNYTAILRTSQS